MSKFFYKVVDAPELRGKVEEAKRFFMRDLNIKRDVSVSFLELGNDNLSHRVDYFVDRFITGDHYKKDERSGIKTRYEIAGQMCGQRRILYIVKNQSWDEIIRTLAHELKHFQQNDLGMLDLGAGDQNGWQEKAAVSYESTALHKYREWKHSYVPTREEKIYECEDVKRGIDDIIRSFGKVPTGSYYPTN